MFVVGKLPRQVLFSSPPRSSPKIALAPRCRALHVGLRSSPLPSNDVHVPRGFRLSPLAATRFSPSPPATFILCGGNLAPQLTPQSCLHLSPVGARQLQRCAANCLQLANLMS